MPFSPRPALLAALAVLGGACQCGEVPADDPNACTPENHCVSDAGDAACEPGYDWLNPDSPDDFRCVPVDGGCGDACDGRDAGPDASSPGADAGPDAGRPDAGGLDAGHPDASVACTDLCPTAGERRCASGSISTCEREASGCLNWTAPSACATGACASATQCQAGTCGAGSLEWLRSPVQPVSSSGSAGVRRLAAHDDGSLSMVLSVGGTVRLGAGTSAETTLVAGSGGETLAHFDSSAAFAWRGSVLVDDIARLVPVAQGAVVIGGSFNTSTRFNYGQPSAFTFTAWGGNGDTDGFLARVEPGGTVSWARQVTGDDIEEVRGIAAHSNGSIAVGGYYGALSNTVQLDNGRGGRTTLSSPGNWEEGFLALYNGAGVLQWAYTLGGPNRYDAVYEVGFLTSGDIVVLAKFTDSITFGARAGGQTVQNAGSSMALAVYTSAGDLRWVRIFQGVGGGTGPMLAPGVRDDIQLALTLSNGARLSVGQSDEHQHVATIASAADTSFVHYGSDGKLLSVNVIAQAFSPDDFAVTSAGTALLVGGARPDYANNPTRINTVSGPVTLGKPAGHPGGVALCTADMSQAEWLRQSYGPRGGSISAVTSLANGDIYVAGFPNGYAIVESDAPPGLASTDGTMWLAKFKPTSVTPAQPPPAPVTLADPCATPSSCPAMATKTKQGSRALYYRGVSATDSYKRLLQKIWPTVSSTALGPFDSSYQHFFFRERDGGLFALGDFARTGLWQYGSGTWTSFNTFDCWNTEFGFDLSDRLVLLCDNDLYDAAGKIILVGTGYSVLAVLADGRMVVTRPSAVGPAVDTNQDVVVLDANGVELSRLAAQRTGVSSALPIIKVTASGNEAYLLLRLPSPLPTGYAVYALDAQSRWFHLRDVSTSGFGSWEVALPDGSVAARHSPTATTGPIDITLYEPGQAARVIWDSSSPGPTTVYYDDELLVGPP